MQHSFLLNSHRRSIKLSPPFPGQEPGDVPPIPVPPYPQQSPLGRKAEPCLWVFRCARPKASRDFHPFIPIAGFILFIKSRNRPFEQIRRNQHHRGKVLFTVPSFCLFTVRARPPGRSRAHHEETCWYAERDSNPQDPASETGMCTGFIICTSEGFLPGRRPPGAGRRTRHVVLLDAPASRGSRTRPKLLNR